MNTENSNNGNKRGRKNILLVITVVLLAILVVGGTYAVLMVTLPINVTNGVYNYNTVCFDIDYSGKSVFGVLVPSSGPTGGLSAYSSVGISADCNIEAVGVLSFNVNEVSNTLVQTVDAHCENPTTLSTLTDYTTSSDCTTAGGEWVTSGTALKYALYNDLTADPITTGYITDSGSIDVYSNFTVSQTQTDYYFYVWLDGNLSDNSYAAMSFDGEMDIAVHQVEDGGSFGMTAYAVYSADDTSLRFYKTESPITVGSTYNGRTVTAVYTGFEEATYSSATEVPWWSDYYSTITTVVVEDSIKPISTQYWFYTFYSCTSMDLTNLDTSNVTSMAQMFYRAGGETFEIVGLDNWDVSKVTNMNGMFYRSAYSATTFDIGDISGWDTSSVTDMSMMFYQAGYNATYTLNLSSWNVNNVTSYTDFNNSVASKVKAPTWVN